MSVLALDIGGANLKWAHSDGRAGDAPFALWQAPEALADRLEALCAEHASDALLVTMTGELCDCFATRRAGVHHLLDAVTRASRSSDAVHVWSIAAGFVTPEAARIRPLDVAAGNWHALATWAARRFGPTSGVLIDVGSTTSDLIPLDASRCVARGQTDTQRLAAGELVYLGAARTPLMAVTSHVTWHGERIGVMAEQFATMADALALVNELEPPASAATRVLRMVGADLDTHTRADAVALAQSFVDAARERLVATLRPHAGVAFALVGGSGEALGEQAARAALPGATCQRLSDIIGPAASRAACAHALLQLWESRCANPSQLEATS